MDLLFGAINRQIITVAVRHGKSAWHSVILPAWYILTFPDNLVLLSSYGSDLSSTFAVQVREIVREAAPRVGLELDPQWKGRSSFRIKGRRGGLEACGVCGPINGKGFHLVIADDLVKDEEAARSPVERSNLLNWWMGDAMRRLEPRGKVCLIMSRKHPQDIAGTMLSMNPQLPVSQRWHQTLFQAIDNEGHALWPERYSVDELMATKRELELAGKSHFWSSMYQQEPRSDPGACEFPDSYFKNILYTERPSTPIRCKVIACDPSKGAKSKAGDYCAILTMILDTAGTLWIDDVWMRPSPMSECVEQFAATIVREKPHGAIAETMLGAELLILDAQRLLDAAGCRVPLYPYQSNENKNVRMRMAWTGWLAKGRVKIRDTMGGRLLVGQLQELPSGQHDDGCDAGAMGISLFDELLG